MTQTADRDTLEEVAGALDAATAAMADLDPAARQVATGAVDALNALHRVALTTVVRTLKADPRGKELLFELVDEPEVRMVLALHGIIRPDPLTVANQVLDGVRVGLHSHGGDVELDSITDGVAYVRLQGACNGCSMAAVTMRNGVEAALVQGVPGVTRVEVLANDPSPTLIPLSSIGVGPPSTRESTRESTAQDELLAAGWCPTVEATAVPVGELVTAMLRPEGHQPVEVVVVNAAGQLAAYVNECAHQGLPLDNALVDATASTLTCPWHGFCYDSATGECLTMPGAQLQQLPLRIEADRVWVRAVGG